MTSTTPTLQSASLHFREGNSDKVYHAAIEPKGEGYLVTFAYGRRGNTLIHDHRQMIRAFCFDRRRMRS